jgi:Glycerophosphoryl diester phosphodiesterase family
MALERLKCSDERPLWSMRGFLPSSRSPLIFAHRGLVRPGRWPNTLPAFEAALDAGADAIECDVRLAEDHRNLFVFHNRGLRVDGRQREASALDASTRSRLQMPDLADVLALRTRWPDRGIVLDVKARDAGQVLVELLQPDPSILIISFSDAVVSLACRHGFNAGLIEGFLPMILRDLAPSDSYLCPSLERLPGYADELTDAELAIANVGTVNDPATAMTLARRGVWALTTDRCEEVKGAVRDLDVR